jgi:Domain of unknown function (DUF5076)
MRPRPSATGEPMNKKAYETLSIPPGGRQDGGVEVLRAGISANNNLTLSLRPALADPQHWGVLLATVARQVAVIYAQERGMAADAVCEGIRAKFIEEMASSEDPGTIVRAK